MFLIVFLLSDSHYRRPIRFEPIRAHLLDKEYLALKK